MIKARVIEILKLEALKNPALEELTGISRYTWQNIRNKPEREIKEEEIVAIANLFKKYRYWLISGEELPEAGQVSPVRKIDDKYRQERIANLKDFRAIKPLHPDEEWELEELEVNGLTLEEFWQKRTERKRGDWPPVPEKDD